MMAVGRSASGRVHRPVTMAEVIVPQPMKPKVDWLVVVVVVVVVVVGLVVLLLFRVAPK